MNKSEISFGRVIRVCLMIVILMLAGCSSKPIPSAAATATHEATATSTATLKSTPTAVEITPTLVEGAVVTDQGSVFIEDGKYMLIDAKGIKNEIKDISTEVTFNTMKDASDIVLAMHVKEFANQNRADYFPGKLDKSTSYVKAVDEVLTVGRGDYGYATVFGFMTQAVKIKSESPEFPERAVFMLNVFGDKTPFPYTVGLFNKNAEFSALQDNQQIMPLETFPEGKIEVPYPENLTWTTLQKMVGCNIVEVPTLSTVPTGLSAKYIETWNDFDTLSSAVRAERLRLLQIQAKQAEVRFDYLVNKDGTHQTGMLFAVSGQTEGEIVILSEFSSLMFIDLAQ